MSKYDHIWTEENRWTSGPLPTGPNTDNRPVWEPPIFSYTDMTDDYEKQCRAVLKYADDDVVKTTAIMDEMIDKELINRYVT